MKLLQQLKAEEGVNLLEYAFIAILSMLLILGITDFGRMLYTYHYLSNTAREAARWASVNGSTCHDDLTCTAPAGDPDISDYVKKITPPGLDTANPPLSTTVSRPVQANGPQTCTVNAAGVQTCTAICSATKNAPGCTVEVQVSYSFTFLFPLIRSSNLTLTSTSMMVIAH
jgi:Flp pilus assembly protein TadG